MDHFYSGLKQRIFVLQAGLVAFGLLVAAVPAVAAFVEFNNTGGTNATNGLHFYIEDTTHLQVRRENNTGQVYSPGAIPPSNNLDNGIFLRANGLVYGKSHSVGGGFNPTGGMFNTFSISATSPANPSSPGVQQVATNNLGITSGPQISVVWKYTTPLDFVTAEVTLTIPPAYAVSVANPVRYFHVFDTYLGGSDSGCGVKFTDTNSKLVVGTYSRAISGPACPSSSVPSGTVVESFRERSGLPFSSYCAAGWQSFFVNGGVNCSVLQAAALSNTIVTAYQDTGIGIAYNFTAAGTYTFSYDFVIGTTVVPAYDHIEIVHDGSATLCPETLQVLACTSSTVPCPIGNLVNTGTITGQVTEAPASAGVTLNPVTFSIGDPGSGGSTANVVLQATAAAAGTYTLGVTNISGTPPLNGTKCSNGTIATSCTIVIANTPCVANFECLETGKPYNNLTSAPATRNPLYTKLAGTNFKFDVVALQALGVPATTYTAAANVVVELFDDSASPKPACNAYSSPVASQAITFIAGDLGRKTLPAFINLPKAYGKLICRVRDSNITPNVYGCSSDDFAVRPVAPVLNTTATAVGPSETATPVVKAGVAFTLGASTAPADFYNGSLVQDLSKLTAQISTNRLTQQIGGTVGSLNLYGAALPTTLNLTANQSPLSNNASYSEVGYLYAAPGSFRDESFTAVDLLPAGCAATNTCDCITTTVGDANLSDVLDVPSNRYGCAIGNKAAVSFGRFIPDHFSVLPPTFNGFCAAGGFIYMDQPFNLNVVVQARSLGNTITMNYYDFFGKAVVTPQMLNSAAPTTIVANARLIGLGSPAWGNGAYTFTATQFSRQAPADGPYDALSIGLGLADVDLVPLWDRNMDATNPGCTPDLPGTSSSAVGACKAVTVATTKMRHGRLKLGSVHGSELLALPVPMRLEYWNGVAGWNPNTLDTCSNFSNTNFSLEFPVGTATKPNNLAACETVLTTPAAAPAQKLLLSAPGAGNNGWTNLTLNLAGPSGNQCVAPGPAGPLPVSAGMPWLQYNWFGTGLANPKVRATFGVYKNANEFIYLREVH